MGQNKKDQSSQTTGSVDVLSDVSTNYSSSVSINEISGGHSEASFPKQTDSLRNIRQVSVNTIDFINLQTPRRAAALPLPFPTAHTRASTHSTPAMIRGNSKQKIKTRQAVAIEKSTGAKKVVSTRRNDCDLKNHDGDLKKLLLEDQECNKLLLSVKDSKRQRQMKVEEQQKNLAEARKYHKVLISRKMTQAKKIKSVNKTVGRGVPLHASQEDILLHEMLVTQERIQRSKVKVLETELSALTGLPPRSPPMPKLQRPKPAFKIPNLVFQKVENDSLPPVGVQEKVKYSGEVYDQEKGLGKRKEFTVPVACVRQVPPLDLSKLLDDSLSAVGKKPTVPAVYGQKGRKLIASGNCAARQNKDHDKISRSVVLPDIKDSDKTKFFIPNIFNCKSIL